jgi:hypothetical protein
VKAVNEIADRVSDASTIRNGIIGRAERSTEESGMAAREESDRVLIARLAAHSRWANESDRNPDPDALVQRFEHMLRAHMTRLALATARAQREARATDVTRQPVPRQRTRRDQVLG